MTYYAIVFSKLNCTQKWYLAGVVNSCTALYYLIRSYFVFGLDEDLCRTAHCSVVLVCVHFILCFKEEMALRDSFYKEVDLRSTRESFRRTLDSVPEALLIRGRNSKELLFTNKALKQFMTRLNNDCLEYERCVT